MSFWSIAVRMASAGVLGLRATGGGRVRASRPARAFTIVEIAIVIAVVSLVLAIAVPALRKISEDTRFSSALQTLSGALTRAHATALADKNMTAIRFAPAAWELDEKNNAVGEPGRQGLASYRYVAASLRENSANGTLIPEINEYFERRPSVEPIVLPVDVWVAPVEAWRATGSAPDPIDPGNNARRPVDLSILGGTINSFRLSPFASGEEFLEADDFLIVFDPQTGLRATRERYRLRGYDPVRKRDALDDGSNNWNTSEKFERSSSEGLVIYRREPFAALGDAATGATRQERQNLLRRFGRPYFVHRLSGALVTGTIEE